MIKRNVHDHKIKELFADRYTVTKDGKVYSNYYSNGWVFRKHYVPLEMRQNLILGYSHVSLRYNSKCFSMGVHRIMAIVFHGLPEKGHVAGHLNDIKNDNRIENIKWMTVAENAEYARKNGKLCIGFKHARTLLNMDKIIATIILRKNQIPAGKIAKMLDIDVGVLHNMYRGKSLAPEFNKANELVKLILDKNKS